MTAFLGIRTKVLTLAFVTVLISAVAHAETARYDLDPEHTTIGFGAGHMVVSQVQGQFMVFDGFIEMDPEAKVVKAIETTIKTWSVDTNHQKRDAHLRSPDFLDVDRYPTMTYTMKSYQRKGEQYSAIGDLTLHGVTKPVTLVGTMSRAVKDPMGAVRVGFVAEGTFNRRDFNMTFNALLDSGGMIVGNDITITINGEYIKAKTTAP